MAPKRRKGEGRVAFLANLNKFRELLDAGYTQRTIYEDHIGILEISYAQFNRYVGKYLRIKERSNEQQNKTTTENGNPRKKGIPFYHDPNAANSRDDLI